MRRRGLTLTAVWLALLAVPGAALADDSRLTVMTRNLYVGSSFSSALTAQTPAEFVQGVSTIWANVRRTDFRTRAKLIADEIAANRPGIVGIQEASRWERAESGSSLEPVADYLQILLDELRARGLSYRAATVVSGFTVTAPAFEDGRPVTLRLTDRDAILVRTDLRSLDISSASGANFAARLSVPTALGFAIDVPRMWTQVDGTFEGRRFRLVNTHLDPDSPAVQVAQARELLAGPYATDRPLIAVGDFNSAADGSSTASYGVLTGAGLLDAWEGAGGFTCCQAELLDNPASQLNERIDLVLTGTGARAKDAHLIGALPEVRVAGLWPSDHAGVVAGIKIGSAR
jgi:endonuclease/exonuclease/phosphatase family metal-dependent hydrolase